MKKKRRFSCVDETPEPTLQGFLRDTRGFVEYGETVEEAAIREAKEEA